jgi:hypothetical protein
MEYKRKLPDGSELSINTDINDLKLDIYNELWLPVTLNNKRMFAKIVDRGLQIYLKKEEAIAGKHGTVIISIDNNVLQQLLNRKKQLIEKRKQLLEQYYNNILRGTVHVQVCKIQTDCGIETRIVPLVNTKIYGYEIYSKFAEVFKNTIIEDSVLEGEYTINELRRISKKVDDMLNAVEEEKQRIKEETELTEQRQQYANSKGKTIVHVIECLECGVWRIVGGSKDKLPYQTFVTASTELRKEQDKAYKEQSKEVSLSRIVLGSNNNSKLFDLETEHFCFLIVDKVFGCEGCVGE